MSEAVYTVIGGKRVKRGLDLIPRENPARSSEIALQWEPCLPEDAYAAVETAASLFPIWRRIPLEERCKLLSKFTDETERDAADLAEMIVRENGKPRRDALAEIRSAIADARHSIQLTCRAGLVEHFLEGPPELTRYVSLEPIGPCLLITPFNFPFATVFRKLIPALLHGNTVIVKPSEFTPGSAAAIVTRVNRFLPQGTVSLVLGFGSIVGPALLAHPSLRGISFTGSRSVGLELSRLCAERDVNIQLELGGKNSLIVLDDAHLDKAVDAALIAGFGCSGQWCTGTGRVIVATAVIEEFIEKLRERAKCLTLGPGDDDSSDMGPLITASRVQFCADMVSSSISSGARLETGGSALPDGHFFAPTILSKVDPAMPAALDELFVPVLPILEAPDDSTALRFANLGDKGLSASVFSQDSSRALSFVNGIEAGIVHVNLHTAYREPGLPVKGWRESGRGIPECGRYYREFFTRPKATYLGKI